MLQEDLSKDERTLLENVLIALDRLYDNETTVTDLHALLFATSKALVDSEYRSHLEPVADELLSIRRTLNSTAETRRDAALIATDNLRSALSAALPSPQ